jgi:hypothetical protein
VQQIYSTELDPATENVKKSTKGIQILEDGDGQFGPVERNLFSTTRDVNWQREQERKSTSRKKRVYKPNTDEINNSNTEDKKRRTYGMA